MTRLLAALPLALALGFYACVPVEGAGAEGGDDKGADQTDGLFCFEKALDSVNARFGHPVDRVEGLYEGGSPLKQVRMFHLSPAPGATLRVMTVTEGNGASCRVQHTWVVGGNAYGTMREGSRTLASLDGDCMEAIDEAAEATTDGFYRYLTLGLVSYSKVEGRRLLTTSDPDHIAVHVRTKYNGEDPYDVLVVAWNHHDGKCGMADGSFAAPLILAGPEVAHQYDGQLALPGAAQ